MLALMFQKSFVSLAGAGNEAGRYSLPLKWSRCSDGRRCLRHKEPRRVARVDKGLLHHALHDVGRQGRGDCLRSLLRLRHSLTHLGQQAEEEGQKRSHPPIFEGDAPLDVFCEATPIQRWASGGQVVGEEDWLVEGFVVHGGKWHVEAREASLPLVLANHDHAQRRQVHGPVGLEFCASTLCREGNAIPGKDKEFALHRNGL
mmetsp:Transcript_806/g.2205  ORF Transcript_806/g.2205 Transcript_806/m.2205 type:complete len:202 (+) Transcript_806:452-1057(+)